MNVFLSSKTVEIAEHADYLELLNRVCYYDAPNLNSALLPYDETTEEKAKTLIGMPVVSKYTVDAAGKPTFKGHEVSFDSNGELVFGTTPIGVHVETYVKEDSVELPDKSVATHPCLFAKMKIWTRNRNAIAAIRRLYAENNLHNSWEISVQKYEYSNGIKRIIDYSFIGNALIGVAPAYGSTSKVLSLSTESTELLVAEALSQDLIEASENPTGSEVIDMEDEKTLDTSEEEVNTGCVEIGEKEGEETPAAASHEETGAAEEQAKEEVAPVIEESVEKIDPVQSQLAEALSQTQKLKTDISEKNSALIEAQKQINDLTAQVELLTPYKEAAESAAREKAESERKEAVAALRTYAEESGMVSKEELASGEIAEMIESLKETDLKVLISDRIVAKQKDVKSTETASAEYQPKVRTDISSSAADDQYTIFRTKLFGK